MSKEIRPTYYKSDIIFKGRPIECIDVIEFFGLGFHLGNALKYLWRLGLKGGEDLISSDVSKATWYMERWRESFFRLHGRHPDELIEVDMMEEIIFDLAKRDPSADVREIIHTRIVAFLRENDFKLPSNEHGSALDP